MVYVGTVNTANATIAVALTSRTMDMGTTTYHLAT